VILRVLLYHRVDDPACPRADLNPDLVSATPASLEQQVRHLTRFYQPVGAREVLAALAGRSTLPPRSVLVTFDDGYRDFLHLAWPILERHRVPAVLFVPSAFVDDPDRVFWWDGLWQMLTRTRHTQVALPRSGVAPLRSHADQLRAFRAYVGWLKSLEPATRLREVERLAERLGVRPEPPRAVLTWPELRRLAEAGVTVAAHSRTHERLDQLDAAALAREVPGSRDDLVRELGTCLPLFAYPYGNVSYRVLRALEVAGFRAGFTTLCGVNRLPRVNPRLLRRDDPHVPFPRFALKLTGPLAALRTVRHQLSPAMLGAE
jgi:peptidoglycan/xylan/chitin deacetylase (PgdA/CDA1 family)